jgi:hypothetical protein
MKEEHALSEILLKRLDETTVRDLRKLNAVLFPVKYAVSRRAFHSLSLFKRDVATVFIDIVLSSSLTGIVLPGLRGGWDVHVISVRERRRR